MARLHLSCSAVLLVLALALADPAWAAESGRRVIFMVDMSGSMPQPFHPGRDRRPRETTFAEEVALAREKAAVILSDPTLEGDPDVRVSFWTFGQRDSLRTYDDASRAMTVTEAKGRLHELFSADPSKYDHPHTYIAYSIFQLAQNLLGADRVTLDGDIPEDASLLYVFVFTDGAEDVDRGFDNQPYIDWLNRQERRLQIRWRRWKLYADEEERARQERWFQAPDLDRVVYDVHFGVPTNAYFLDPQHPPPDATADLQVPRLIRLVPALGGAAPPAVAGEAQPLVCTADAAPLQNRPGGTLLAQARVDWKGEAPAGATSEWRVTAPPRGVEQRPAPDRALPAEAIERDILRLQVAEATPAVLPGTDVADGAYAVRFVFDSLCEELKRTYPNSTFVFPVDATGALKRLGAVTVHRTPQLAFVLAAEEGAAPDAPLAPLAADRFHCYSTSTRTFRLTPPDGTTAQVAWSVSVSRDGEPLDAASDIVTLTAGDTAGGSLSAPAGEDVALRVPAASARWYECLLGDGFGREAGDYELTLCARPEVTAAPVDDYTLAVVCPQCEGGDGLQALDGLCVRVPLAVGPRPWSWALLAALLLAAIIALWIVVRWATRPQFPKGLQVGMPISGRDLRTSHGRGWTGVLALYGRKPLYVDLKTNEQTQALRVPQLPGEKKRSSRTVLGLRPSPNDRNAMLLWLASVAEDDQGCSRRVHVSGRADALGASLREPRRGSSDKLVLRYDRFRSTPVLVEIRRACPEKPDEVLETYRIHFK